MKLDGSNWVQVGNAFSTGKATYTSLAFSADGNPYVAFRDEASMRRTTVMKYASVTGLSDLNRDEKIEVYPNPNNGIFTIDLPNAGAVKYSVEIINLTGQIVYSGKLLQGNEHQINLKGKLKGIYLLKVELGAESFQKKIIVH